MTFALESGKVTCAHVVCPQCESKMKAGKLPRHFKKWVF